MKRPGLNLYCSLHRTKYYDICQDRRCQHSQRFGPLDICSKWEKGSYLGLILVYSAGRRLPQKGRRRNPNKFGSVLLVHIHSTAQMTSKTLAPLLPTAATDNRGGFSREDMALSAPDRVVDFVCPKEQRIAGNIRTSSRKHGCASKPLEI